MRACWRSTAIRRSAVPKWAWGLAACALLGPSLAVVMVLSWVAYARGPEDRYQAALWALQACWRLAQHERGWDCGPAHAQAVDAWRGWLASSQPTPP